MKNGKYELIIPPKNYPGKKYRGKYAYEHRVVWWKTTGLNPDLFPKSVIHHKDDQKRNNDKNNLELLNKSLHTANHNKANSSGLFSHICMNCKITFYRRKSLKPKFCSRRCIGLYCHRTKSIP